MGHEKVDVQKIFDTYVVGVNCQPRLQDRKNASTNLRSNNIKGAWSETTRLDLPAMRSDTSYVYQDQVSAKMRQQRGTPVEGL